MKNIGYIIRLINKACKSYTMFSILKKVIEDVFYVFLEIYLIQLIFNNVEADTSFSRIITFLTLLALLQVLIHVLSAVYDYYRLRKNPILFKYFYGRVISKSIRIKYSFFESPDFFDKYTRTIEDLQLKAEHTVDYLAKFIAQSCKLVVTLIIIIQMNAWILVFPLISVCNAFWVSKIRGKLEYERNNEITLSKRKADYFMRIFSEKKYSEDVRNYPVLGFYEKKYDFAIENIKHIFKTYWNRMVFWDLWDKFIYKSFVFIGSTIFACYMVMVKETLSLGTFISIMVLINSLSWSVDSIIDNYSKLRKEDALIGNIFFFLERTAEYEEKENKNDNLYSVSNFESIKMQNVSFLYPGAQKYSLQKVNLEINKNDKIAIIGSNGAGKTTLIKLLLNLYMPTEGELLINNRRIDEINIDTYRKHVATIFQDFQMYATTIASNVLMNIVKDEEDEKIVRESLQKVGMLDKINALPKDIHTMLTKEFDPEGVVFSGGELQKIAVARVFAQNADILILDEPSSAMDPIAEFEFFQRLIEFGDNHTMIFISHRLSSAHLVDKVIYMEDGLINDIGTHNELLEKNKKYSELYNIQAQNYLM